MSPDLERLLQALWEVREGEPQHRKRALAQFDRLMMDALNSRPMSLSEQMLFRDALETRYLEFRRARRKPTSLPPKA